MVGGKLLSPQLTARLSMLDAEGRQMLIAEIVAQMHERVIRQSKRKPEKRRRILKEQPNSDAMRTFA